MTALRKMWILGMAVCLFAFAPAALAGPARFITVDVPVPDAQATYVLGTNSEGCIVGAYFDKAGNEHGFVLHALGAFVTIDYPGAVWTEAHDITSQGDIIGQYGLADNTTHGFLLRGGNFYPVEVPGPTDLGYANSMPFKISPSGMIVGCYHQSKASGAVVAGTMHGFAMSADGVVFDSTAGSMHLGVNPDSAITGYNASSPQSYVIADGVTTWFVYPGAAVTRATDIAPNGHVIGWYKDASGHFHGFVKRQETFTNFDVELPGVLQTRPYGINAVGEIVGYYQDATGWHGFLYSRRGPQ